MCEWRIGDVAALVGVGWHEVAAHGTLEASPSRAEMASVGTWRHEVAE